MSNKNKHNKSVGSSIERSNERLKVSGEFFTPLSLCSKIVNEIPLDILKNPESKFLDNSAGNGSFLLALTIILKEYHSEKHIKDNMLYAIELMEDNHKELCERLGVSVDHKHYVCANALEYDYSFGEPVGLEKFMI
tara:strand:- start:308 stop:715 length:408 start_codon:yes stop_codon:yes gene_type:complete